MTSKQAAGNLASKTHKSQAIPPSLRFWAVLFALAYGQPPIFTSNQNQYFLHGLAKAGYR